VITDCCLFDHFLQDLNELVTSIEHKDSVTFSAAASRCEPDYPAGEDMDLQDTLQGCSQIFGASSHCEQQGVASRHMEECLPQILGSGTGGLWDIAGDKSVESSLTSCVRKIGMQSVELWLASTNDIDRMENDSLCIESEALASSADVLAHYLDAAFAEPLQYWLSTKSDAQGPNTDNESVAEAEETTGSTSFTWLEAEFDVAWLSSCIDKVLCKPDSFWLASSCHNVTGSEIAAPPSHCNVNVCDMLPPQSCITTEVVANGSSVSFEFKSVVDGCRDPPAYLALLT